MVSMTVANGGWPMTCLITTASSAKPKEPIIITVNRNPNM